MKMRQRLSRLIRSQLNVSTIRKKIANHPFASKAKNQKPRILTITQGTYDGVLYNAEQIKEMQRRFGSAPCVSPRLRFVVCVAAEAHRAANRVG